MDTRHSRVATLAPMALLMLLVGLVGSATAAEPAGDAALALEKGFIHPPDSAGPHTWWHWMDGNITREGITKDLEAMKRVGVGGAQIFDVQPGIPPGPVRYGSAQWRAMVKHAAQEADRLGLELCMHNCAGWSSSGGPWVKPEQAMQMVTVSEVRAKGPGRFEGQLPQPPTRVGFYRDIAVLAFPTPPAEAARMVDLAPRVTASVEGFDAGRLLDGKPETASTLFLRSSKQPETIQFEFAQPFTAQALTILPAGGGQGSRNELQVSDDGVTFRKVVDFGIPEPTILRPPMTVNFAPATGRFFRLAFQRVPGQGGAVSLAEVALEPGFRLSNWAAKAGYVRADNPPPDTREAPAEVAVNRGQVVDLTRQMDATGKLTWDAPAGNWTILRFGYTPTGKDNHPAPEEGRGLECDKLSSEAVEAHFAGNLAKVMADLGPLAGKGLKHLLIDSYEVDCQNWTPRFREEFEKRRGYDPLPFLPAMTGRVVGSLDASERFLWDVRRTIADLFADNYYGHYAEICHRYGLKLSAEPYGNGNFDNLTSGDRADIPMTEFWAGWGNDNSGSKLASSMAHTTGRKVVGAESFTAAPENGRWTNTPYSMKALGDLIYCGGVNRFIFHRYAHQPWLDLRPGMTMGPWGIHFERTITWWDQSPAWLTYLARCQYLLQSGLFVADLCYFYGEGAPNDLPGRQGLSPLPPRGYDYDGCDAEVILTRMAVKGGRIVLPHGMSYRVLVLRPDRTMTPAVLRKIRDLVRGGATVVGPKPLRSPSLQGYPDADQEVQALAEEIWGPCDGQKVTQHAYGQGMVIWGKPLEEVFAAQKLGPDFRVLGEPAKAGVNAIHRTVDGADVYFVADQNRRPDVVECSFCVAGTTPELWHPDTGKVEPAPVYRVEGGRTVVPLRFDPAGSVFVVFRAPAGAADPIVAATRNGESLFAPRRPSSPLKLEVRRAEYGVFTVELPEAVDVTAQLQRMVRDGRLTVRADNSIAGDPAQNVVKQMRVDYALDGKPASRTVEENQTLTLPDPARGEKGVVEVRRAIYGVLPEPGAEPSGPRTVDVTEKLRGMIRDNTLTVAATNELAGDPTPLVVKQMRVDYALNGQAYTRVVAENDTLALPDGTEAAFAVAEAPASDLEVPKAGRSVVTAWEPGTYQATTASGKRLKAGVAELPPRIDIGGPWELRFPPKLGAPERATLEKLASWTESPESGIKYFSGTATYVKQVDIPPKALEPGNVLMLDLGTVKEIAEVSLNGKDLGVLWKPPFRVDITGAAKPGVNRLEVRVTNLWPNRLIGDEQLPDDCEWLPGGALKAWPAWLVEGKPRPATGRITFTTWKHYTKDSPLLESGLLGPVTVRVGRRVPLTPG